MKKEVKNLYKHKKKVYSQNGEEGVLEYLLERLPKRDNWCVEFGAWDGIHLSNTFYFIEKYNFNAVYIEGDKEKAKQLEKNMSKYKNNLREIICLDKFVEINGDNSLDALLSRTKIPTDFDLLSVDIDSDDYHILKSLEKYKPKIVIVEINQLIKPGIEQINKIGEFQRKGSLDTLTSISSMTKMMNQKDYALVANIRTNAIYVKKEYLNLFYAVEPTEFEVFTYEDIRFKDLKPKEALQRLYYMGFGYVISRILKRLGVS